MNGNLVDCQSIDKIKNATNTSWKVWNTPTLFTIGYEGKSIDTFINKLLSYGILALVDVRHNPLSRKPGFSKNAFRAHLEESGIDYYHIPELGVPSQYRKNLRTEEAYRVLFEYYERQILPVNLASINMIKELSAQYQRLAITCFEADYLTCHRHKITDFLSEDTAFEIKITHL
jgi:uncharacterized protein (DUF488 family)